MRNLLILTLTLLSSVGIATPQCEMGIATSHQVSCGSIYRLPGPAPNPPLGDFLNDYSFAFKEILSTTPIKPQTPILLAGFIQPLLAPYISSDIPVFGPAGVPYMAALKTYANVTTQDLFPYMAAGAASPTYPTHIVGGDIVIPTDCPGSTYLPYSPTTETLPPGAGSLCTMLYYTDAAVTFAAHNGIQLRGGFAGLQPAPGGNAATYYCGLSGTISATQFIQCFLPLTQALISRYPAGTFSRWQVVVEPFAALSSIQRFSVSDIATIISTIGPAIKAIDPGIKIGATANGTAWQTSQAPHTDICYWYDWAGGAAAGQPVPDSACDTTPTATYQYVDYLGIDLFAPICNPSNGSGGWSYADALTWYRGNFLAATANPFGKDVYIGQLDPPVWCIGDGSVRSEEANAYLGRLDAIWQTSGFRNQWQSTLTTWASAFKIKGFSVFCNEPWFYNTQDQPNDNCATGAGPVNAVLGGLSPNDTAYKYSILTKWWQESLQGGATLTGRAGLVHH
jgi:hypothetical protein